MMAEYTPGDTVVMKKAHPCGANSWIIIRMGMDVRLRCAGCGRTIEMKRRKFDLGVKGKE